MTPEQKIIAIAEFEGWKELRDGRWKLSETSMVERFLQPYLTSRDAICGAVARLDDEQKDKFANYLYDIYLGFNEDPEFHQSELHLSAKSVTNMILATPTQLADALLLTLGYEI